MRMLVLVLSPSSSVANTLGASMLYLGKFAFVRERMPNLARIMSSILHEDFFNELRTNQQLGYVVFADIRCKTFLLNL